MFLIQEDDTVKMLVSESVLSSGTQIKAQAVAIAGEETLFSVSSMWPFDLFPDQLTVDRTKVSFVFNSFWGVRQLRSVVFGRIMDVIVEATPFFASLTVIDGTRPENFVSIKFLRPEDAIHARRIIQGLVVLKKEGKVDLSKLSSPEARQKAEEAGKARI